MSALSDKLVRQMRAIYPTYPIVQNAADEIDRLAEENARLREALAQIALDIGNGDETSAYAIARAALTRETI